MGSQVLYVDSLWQHMFHQVARRVGEQDLPAMSSAHDAGSPMYVQAHVPLSRALRFTGMQSHAHTNRDPIRPGMAGKGVLGFYGCCHSIAGTRKGDEEGI